MAEGRWQSRALRDALPDIGRQVLGADPRGCFSVSSAGTWSSGRYLPAGAIVNRRTGHAWAWQIEHNGGWHWEVGECASRTAGPGPGPQGRHAPPGAVSGAYLALLGPVDAEHHWQVTLSPGEAFTTVPASLAVSPDGFDGAVAGAHRRPPRDPPPARGPPAAARHLQRLHEHADGRPHHRAPAAADRRRRRRPARSTSASTPAGTRRSAKGGGIPSARGVPPAAGSPAGSPRSSTTSGRPGWCRACGSNPRWSASTARSPGSCPPTPSSSAAASSSSSTAATTWTCVTPRR